ncbi:hypothetical protein V1477_006102, partial [Vespula maculifrons]
MDRLRDSETSRPTILNGRRMRGASLARIRGQCIPRDESINTSGRYQVGDLGGMSKRAALPCLTVDTNTYYQIEPHDTN